jgi:hypothetical protein
MKFVAQKLIAAVLLVLSAEALGSSQFQKASYYQVGVEPQQVVLGDFNNDGKMDTAAPDTTSLDISILLGNGDGSFQPALTVSAGAGPSALATGDFNHDGLLDLAVTEYGLGGPGYLQVFLGKGDGTFTLANTYTIGVLPYDITLADFDGDGNLDVATANNGVNAVSILFGNGDGTFRQPVHYFSPLPERVLAADLNGDGHPDLISLAYCGPSPKHCHSGSVQVWLNQGNGTFGSSTYFSVMGVGPDGVAAADFNNDGKLDLAVANNNFQAASVVSILLGNGDGTFQPAVTYSVGGGPAGIAIADFNQDGRLDLAVANTGTSNVSLLYGNGDGTFQAATNIPFPTNSLAISVAASDFNDDGAPDLGVALSYANRVAILLNAE